MLNTLRYLLIPSLLALTACERTITVERGKIEPEYRIVKEDFLSRDVQALKEKYIGKKVTALVTDAGGINSSSPISNQAKRSRDLLDQLSSEDLNIDVVLTSYYNFDWAAFQSFGNTFGKNWNMLEHLTPDMIEDRLILTEEDTTQPRCGDLLKPEIMITDQRWPECQFSSQSFQLTGRVFNLTCSTRNDWTDKAPFGLHKCTLDLIPLAIKYSHPDL